MTDAQFNIKLAEIVSAIKGWVAEWLPTIGNEVVDRNQFQMEGLGETAFGPITNRRGTREYAWEEYAEEKRAMGKEDRFINLNFSGDFHGKMKFKATPQGISIFSEDQKADILVQNYGKNIFGLNDENMDWVQEELLDMLTDRLTLYFK